MAVHLGAKISDAHAREILSVVKSTSGLQGGWAAYLLGRARQHVILELSAGSDWFKYITIMVLTCRSQTLRVAKKHFD